MELETRELELRPIRVDEEQVARARISIASRQERGRATAGRDHGEAGPLTTLANELEVELRILAHLSEVNGERAGLVDPSARRFLEDLLLAHDFTSRDSARTRPCTVPIGLRRMLAMTKSLTNSKYEPMSGAPFERKSRSSAS